MHSIMINKAIILTNTLNLPVFLKKRICFEHVFWLVQLMCVCNVISCLCDRWQQQMTCIRKLT